MEVNLADKIAKACYDHYKKLPKTGKPQSPNVWTHLAAIIKIKESETEEPLMEIVSMATGSKCIGQSKMSILGDIVNDSHAEVLSRRAFLRYLYFHISKILKHEHSEVLDYNPSEKLCFTKMGVSFHLFISHTPCGDASIFLKNSKNKNNENLKRKIITDDDDVDHTIKKIFIDNSQGDVSNEFCTVNNDIFRTGAKCVPNTEQDPRLPGVNYHVTEALRTKPGRGDSTLSLSCSDKIAKWNVVGLQGALLAHFMEPIYLTSIVIGNCPYDEQAMKRAVFERIKLKQNLPVLYKHKCPQLLFSSLFFEHGPRQITSRDCSKIIPASTAIVWSQIPVDKLEVIVNGMKQGVTHKNKNSASSRCNVCKRNLFNCFRELVSKMQFEEWNTKLKEPTMKSYNDFKLAAADYQNAKQCLYQSMDTWPSKSCKWQMFTWDVE